MNGNYIKINRGILDWEWYGNINTCRLFIHMLLKANWKDGKFEGKVIPRGSFISSIPKLSDETDLTQREVRTAIEHLKLTGELTVKTTNKFSMFTVSKYCLYQENDMQNDFQSSDKGQSNDVPSTDNRHSIDSLTTTIEEGKKERREESNISCSSQETEREKDKPPKKDYMADFLIIYKLYPKKSGKTKAYEYYLGWLKGRDISGRKIKLDNRQMYLAVKKYVQQCEDSNTELQFYKNFDTLMNKQILDYIEEDYK